MRSVHKILVEKCKGGPMHTWEYNITADVRRCEPDAAAPG